MLKLLLLPLFWSGLICSIILGLFRFIYFCIRATTAATRLSLLCCASTAAAQRTARHLFAI